ncbi:hypothetical protein [Propionivibrio sp.]|uniref:hypothetical protein n=1 Tax=Propionivibrio sp. TaxID=2212460 RepID=UPI003BEFC9EF
MIVEKKTVPRQPIDFKYYFLPLVGFYLRAMFAFNLKMCRQNGDIATITVHTTKVVATRHNTSRAGAIGRRKTISLTDPGGWVSTAFS